ncbi:MAG: hypothetical protein NC037_04615 [Bacteroides sp.]|nr:hypothetical protein [Bacteroides sp.]
MAALFWQFFFYSFCGFLLEVAFARAIRSPKQDRKCHLLLPVCPVYGVGALAILALPEAVAASPLLLFFAGGTGHPYFSTDTGAALRSCEIGADALLLAKNVDGVYDSDPKLNKGAKKFDKLSYMQVISMGLKAMDTTAITMCMDNNVPIIAFSLMEKDSIKKAVCGEQIGTVISK